MRDFVKMCSLIAKEDGDEVRTLFLSLNLALFVAALSKLAGLQENFIPKGTCEMMGYDYPVR